MNDQDDFFLADPDNHIKVLRHIGVMAQHMASYIYAYCKEHNLRGVEMALLMVASVIGGNHAEIAKALRDYDAAREEMGGPFADYVVSREFADAVERGEDDDKEDET